MFPNLMSFDYSIGLNLTLYLHFEGGITSARIADTGATAAKAHFV